MHQISSTTLSSILQLRLQTIAFEMTTYNGSGPPFPRVRHSESRRSWSLQGIVLDIATIRRLTLTTTLAVSYNRKLLLLEMVENDGPSEWRAYTPNE